MYILIHNFLQPTSSTNTTDIVYRKDRPERTGYFINGRQSSEKINESKQKLNCYYLSLYDCTIYLSILLCIVLFKCKINYWPTVI